MPKEPLKDNKVKIIPIFKYQFTKDEIKFAKDYINVCKNNNEELIKLDFSLEEELLNF